LVKSVGSQQLGGGARTRGRQGGEKDEGEKPCSEEGGKYRSASKDPYSRTARILSRRRKNHSTKVWMALKRESPGRGNRSGRDS